MNDAVYLDNAATSFPKAPGAAEAMAEYMSGVGANLSRGTYGPALKCASVALETRELICSLLGFSHPELVIFTPGVTFGLNAVIKGLVSSGDRIIATAMEHNSVLRPAFQLARAGAVTDICPAGKNGVIDMKIYAEMLKLKTRLVVMTHASNVCGSVQPIEQAARMAHAAGAYFLLDAAQTAGHIPVDMEALGVDALAFSAHKGLLAAPGLGGLLLSPRIAKEIEPLVSGGTGSDSVARLPRHFPDRLEAGTLNIPGIFALCAALKYISDRGVGDISAHEATLTARFLGGIHAGFGQESGVRVLGPQDAAGRVGVVSLDFLGRDNADIADRLCRRGIFTRTGLHCAPYAHKALLSFPEGAVRFSFGAFNTADDIDAAVSALRDII